jgi:signal transduction histidine kinase/CheY-like chemotaxis protein
LSLPILTVTIQQEQDTVNARQRARQIARLLGCDTNDQTRVSTAVSEIARNVFNYGGGGKAEYLIEGRTAPQLLIIRITDHGPGIADLDAILEGRYQSRTGMGLGITGARRLMDQFQIDSVPGRGTTVLLKKLLPKRAPVIREADLARFVDAIIQEKPQDPLQELRHQNQELIGALEEIRSRQAELTRVNRELEDTNRGVVALYAELDEKADHLRRADELKSRFLSNMSHEFRSPLNSILALSGLLRDGSDGELSSEQQQQVGYIRRAANDLLELVNDLLDLAKVEAGKVEVKPIHFEVANLFAALRGMLRPLLLNQSVDLVFDEVEKLPTLYTDEGKVSQVLRNFISNALKFTERGEVRVSAGLDENGEVCFTVSDTGIGIAPEDQEIIFQDFVQLDHPIQKRVKGTGLGLPLSKKLAAFLGGRVEVRSVPGAGSTFILRVPAEYADAARKQADGPAEWIGDPSGVPVLCVEDSPEIVMAYRSYMRDSGFQLISAATTREAEDVLDRMRPRVMILDLILRSEETWPFLATLKQNPNTKDIPVLIASTVEDQAKAFHLGADGYIVKPVEPAVLLAELRSFTGLPALGKVLIVDDNELDRYLLKQHLRNLPLTISEASSGTDGIKAAYEGKPDLIFLDLAMPNMNGFEVLEKLKTLPATKDIPVAIVTSRVLTRAERESLLKNAAAVLAKEGLSQAGVEVVVKDALYRILKQTGTEAGMAGTAKRAN